MKSPKKYKSYSVDIVNIALKNHALFLRMRMEDKKFWRDNKSQRCHDISRTQHQKEDKFCMAFMDLQPVNPGHVLVVPKEHITYFRDMDEDLGGHLFRVGIRIDRALRKLASLPPLLKRNVIRACTACIAADRRITIAEGVLLRAVADSLDCPVPPFLPGQTL